MAAPLIIKIVSILLLSAAATIASSVLKDRQERQEFGAPVHNNGPYIFVGCLPEEGQTLISLFSRTGKIVSDTVIPAVTTPTKDPAQDPFLVFFLKDGQRTAVRHVLQDMVDGATQTQSGSTITRPPLICINSQSSPYLEGALRRCQDKTGGEAISLHGPQAFSLGGVIWLCPFFFEHPVFPDPTNCPTVDYATNAHAYKAHGNAVENQFAIILHELAHIYAPHPLGGKAEVYDLNHACYSTPDIQLNNPSNYAYYAASIFLGCNQYPLLPQGAVRSYNAKRQTSTIPMLDPVEYAIDDVPASTIPAFDLTALQSNLTRQGYNLP